MMKTGKGIFRTELSRALRSRRFGLAISVAFLILVVGYVSTLKDMPEKSYIDHWYYIYLRSGYTYLLPLLVALPYADSLVLDRKEGFIKGILARSSYKPYAFAKILANGIAGVLVVSLPLAISYGLLSLTNYNPLNNPALNVFYLRPQEGFLGVLFREHQTLFFLAIIAAVTVMGFLWASLGLSASLVINNRYVALGFPFLLASVLQYFVERALRLPWYLAPSESLLRLNFSYNWLFTLDDLKMVLILPAALLLGSALIWVLFGSRRRVVQSGGLREGAHHAGEQSASPIKAAGKAKPLPVLNVRKPTGAFTAWMRYLRLQAALMLKPYAVIGALTATAAVGVLFGKIMTNVAALATIIEPVELRPLVTAWDVFFASVGNGYSMGLVFTPIFLFLVSNLQPESAYGQMAGVRIATRKRILTAKLTLLLLVCAGYLTLIAGMILMIGRVVFGFPLTAVWSQKCLVVPDSVNMIKDWVQAYSLPGAFFRLMLMLGLAYFALGLLVLAINSLSKRRLVGFFVVTALVLASMALSHVIYPARDWWVQLPIIRNLVLGSFPWPWRLGEPTSFTFCYWLVWIGVLLPVCVWLMRKQEFFAGTETE